MAARIGNNGGTSSTFSMKLVEINLDETNSFGQFFSTSVKEKGKNSPVIYRITCILSQYLQPGLISPDLKRKSQVR